MLDEVSPAFLAVDEALQRCSFVCLSERATSTAQILGVIRAARWQNRLEEFLQAIAALPLTAEIEEEQGHKGSLVGKEGKSAEAINDGR